MVSIFAQRVLAELGDSARAAPRAQEVVPGEQYPQMIQIASLAPTSR
jgi:hypothetical protein